MSSAAQSHPLLRVTHVIYALHAFSLLTGIIGAATVIGAFLTGWPSIIAVILNYAKRSECRQLAQSHLPADSNDWFGLLWSPALFVFPLGLGLIAPGSIGASRSACLPHRAWKLALNDGRPIPSGCVSVFMLISAPSGPGSCVRPATGSARLYRRLRGYWCQSSPRTGDTASGILGWSA
jgi:uncharacterized membrane protein